MRKRVYVGYVCHRRVLIGYIARRRRLDSPQRRSSHSRATRRAEGQVRRDEQVVELEVIGGRDVVRGIVVCASALECSRVYVVRVGGLELGVRIRRVLGCSRRIMRV